MKTLNDVFKKSNELEYYYNNSNSDIKNMILNIFNACYRFGLNETQTIYMINQAVKPFKTDLLEGLLR